MAGQGDEGKPVGACDGGTGASCPICGTGEAESFWSIRQVPVFANVLCETRAEALDVRRGDISLFFCSACGYIWNAVFDPALVEYAPRYENALHFSPRFRTYAEGLARRLIETHGIRGKEVIEIGCGDGQFLVLLCDLGGNRGFGFDPSYDPGRSESAARDDIEIFADYYSEAHSDRAAGLICCRHVLEHVPDPVEFLEGIRRAVGDRTDTILYFEVPNALYTLRDLGIWDILYEHCSYFCEACLRGLFARAGFRVLGARVDYGSQFLAVEAVPAEEPAVGTGNPPASEADLARLIEGFGNAYRRKTAEWHNRLESMKERGLRAVVWGGGTKGSMFLNTVKVRGVVDRVVDINPRKHGMHVPGAGQRIVPPESLVGEPPDTVLMMNPEYENEIRSTLRGLGIQPEVLAV